MYPARKRFHRPSGTLVAVAIVALVPLAGLAGLAATVGREGAAIEHSMRSDEEEATYAEHLTEIRQELVVRIDRAVEAGELTLADKEEILEDFDAGTLAPQGLAEMGLEPALVTVAR